MTFRTVISVTALADNLDAPNWFILDCRGGTTYNKINYERFLKAHIPKAFFYCFSGDSSHSPEIKSTSSSSSSAARETRMIVENLKEFGFDQSSQIIVYGESPHPFVDSMWLLLRSIGYKNVAILQGGLRSWKEQEMPLDSLDT